jgi:two-component system NtrC family response regulator
VSQVKTRVLVTSSRSDYLTKFQGKAPLNYEVFLCEGWSQVEEAIRAYDPHLIVEIHTGTTPLSPAALRHPHLPFLKLAPESLELGSHALGELLVQPSIRLEVVRQNLPFVGKSPVIQRVLKLIDKVAPTEATVLLTGENGTGKELAARALHERSLNRAGRLVAVNCSAISSGLAESELFGSIKGAFTDAQDHGGYVATATGGTLFLDEVADFPLEQQAKMLRLLETRDFRKVGSSEAEKANFRLISASNVDLSERVQEGRFRRDFFHRIHVVEMRLPALRERLEDLPLLVAHFLHLLKARPQVSVSPLALEKLATYSWPGNVRELRNVLERALILADKDELGPEDFEF